MFAEAAIKFGTTEFLAIVGFIYGLASVIVAITPNETDNKWLKKFQGWLKIANVVAGLDLKRGIKKYGPK